MKQNKYDDPEFFVRYSGLPRSRSGLEAWPVDNYPQEGVRHTRWLADDVVKYHRTFATYIDTLIDAGFRIARVLEPAPPPEMLAREPALKDEHRRPPFLLIAAIKP